MELAEAVREDIRNFKKTTDCDALVMVWCGSTEVYSKAERRARDARAFEAAWRRATRTSAPR